MSARARSTRKAAQAVSYVQEEPEEGEEEWISSEEEGGASKRKKRAPKRRKVEVEESDEVTSDEGEDEEEAPAQESSKDKTVDVDYYEIPRVDFSQTLPIEIITEIVSYLSPTSLYYLSTLNKNLHNFFTASTTTSLWRQALPFDVMPKLGDTDLDARKLGAFVLEKECELCGKQDAVVHDEYLLIRLCTSCREYNLVSASQLADEDEYSDFHSATTICAVSTPISARRDRSRDVQLFYLPDLRTIDEHLVDLQILDDADAKKKYVSGPEQDEVRRTLDKAKKLKRRPWYNQRGEQAKELEEGIIEQFSPRVREYIAEREALKKERVEVRGWTVRFSPNLYYDYDIAFASLTWARRTAEFRSEAIKDKIAAGNVFTAQDASGAGLAVHPLLNKPEPFTESIWKQIKEDVYAVVGKDVAAVVFSRSGKKSNRSTLLTKPKSRSAKAWSYVEPHLVQLHKEYMAKKKIEKKRQAVDDKRRSKRPFFEGRYKKLVEMQPNKDAGAYLPRFSDFLALPTVNELYVDDKFGTGAADKDDDLATWSERFDDIVEEVNSYMLDVRLHALKTILAVTTEMDENELEALDGDDLAKEAYGDAFFKRPSSWLSCSLCHEVGPLLKILSHFRQSHATLIASESDTPVMPVRLSLEVACALSAVIELAEVDEDDPETTIKDLKDAFKDKRLIWENPPSGMKKRRQERWEDLIESVSKAADEASKADRVLDVPSIVLKDLSARERRQAYWRSIGR